MKVWVDRHTFPITVSGWSLLWALGLLLGLALLDQSMHEVSIFLVPPFAASLSILLYLPQQPVAQPLPVIAGSTLGALSGTVVAAFVHGAIPAALVAVSLLWLLPRIGIYHPPAIALSMYPLLLYPGRWFPLVVVLPFTLVTVGSHALLSTRVPRWPPYPLVPDHSLPRDYGNRASPSSQADDDNRPL